MLTPDDWDPDEVGWVLSGIGAAIFILWLGYGLLQWLTSTS